MDACAYKTGLADLRTLREDIKKARAALSRLETRRDKQITTLAAHTKAKAEQFAPAAGLSLADVVAIAPALAPDRLTTPAPAADDAAPVTPQPAAGTRPALVRPAVWRRAVMRAASFRLLPVREARPGAF